VETMLSSLIDFILNWFEPAPEGPILDPNGR
jgi:hypothetical protein